MGLAKSTCDRHGTKASKEMTMKVKSNVRAGIAATLTAGRGGRCSGVLA